MDKILTVVIPTYNMELYLRRGLDSLILPDEQMQALEVLVINDGSKDSSSAIAHEYEAQYPQTFRVIDKENGNYGSCVNRGLKEAKGKYIKVLDADDWYDNEALKAYMSILSKIDVDLIINDSQNVHSDGEVVWSVTFPSLPQGRIFNFYEHHVFPLMHHVAYKTENVRKLGYHQTEGVSYTDNQWAFVPMFNVSKAYYIKGWMYKRLVGRPGQTMEKSVRYKCLSHNVSVFEGLLEAYCSKPHREEASRWLLESLMRMINAFYWVILIKLREDHNEILLKFEEFFKSTYSDLYELSNDRFVLSSKCKLKYVKSWREKGKMNYCNPLIFLYIVYQKIRNTDKRLE